MQDNSKLHIYLWVIIGLVSIGLFFWYNSYHADKFSEITNMIEYEQTKFYDNLSENNQNKDVQVTSILKDFQDVQKCIVNSIQGYNDQDICYNLIENLNTEIDELQDKK